MDRSTRRQFLAQTCSAGGLMALTGLSASTWAQGHSKNRPPWRVVQLLDTSAAEQELTRDYATGIRLALTDLSRAGVRVPHWIAAPTDGTPTSVQQALRSLQADSSQVMLLGTVGEKLALTSIEVAQQIGLEIAHVAPWLADARFDASPQVFPIFASRDTQIRHALNNLASTGFKSIGLIYPDPDTERALHPGIQQTTQSLQLTTQSFTAKIGQDMARFGSSLPASMPALLLFLGGTLELAQFTKGLSDRKFQRYVVCLSDVNTTTLQQLGTGAGVPLILTQVVPNPIASSAPVVRAYRAGLKQFYDEPPSSVSLAGYVAGLYAAQTLARLESGATRTTVLAEFQRRSAVDLGGVRIRYSPDGRGSQFVNQTMVTDNWRLIG